MKMNRSVICFLVLIVLAFGLCACVQGPEITDGPTTHNTQAAQPPEGAATNSSGQVTEPAHSHTYAQELVAPTCTEVGFTIFTCECGDSYRDWETAALGHTVVVDEAVEATCTQDGVTEGSHCDSCDTVLVMQETIRSTGHNWSDWETLVAPTEEAEGTRRRTCNHCDAFQEEPIARLPAGHTHTHEAKTVEPTCTQGGYTTYTCACGDSYVDHETAALGHTATTDRGYAATCTIAGKTDGSHCSVCALVLVEQKLIPATGHTAVTDKGYAATCTTAGKTDGSHCGICNTILVKQEILPATDHSYGLQVTKPTCTEQGYTTYTCAVCKDHYQGNYVAALGHNWSDWKILVEPTVESEGRKERSCGVCSAKESSAIDRLPGPVYAIFPETLNVYEASNQEYYLYFTDYKELHWFAQVTYYTIHTDDQIEQQMIAVFEEAFGYTPNEPVTIQSMGKYYVDGQDGVVVYQYAIKDYSVPLVFNEMYTVYEQICTDGVSPWVGFCIYGSDLDDYAAFTQTSEYAALAAQMHKRFEDITGLSISYMRQHPEQFLIDYISIAGMVRTIDGEVFDALYIYCRSLPVNQHKLETVEGIWPTADSDGLTQGERCSVCGTITVPQVTIPSYAAVYSDDYYYEQLGEDTNGDALQQLYRMLDMAAMQFHFDTSIDLANDQVAVLSYADLGLSMEEAVQVWVYYKNDHPLYYWISAWVQYSQQELVLLTESDYSQGDVRAEYNDLIVKTVESYLDMVNGEISSYRIALAFHDRILNSIDYAYESDGVTPEDALWAHRVLGVFDGRGVVCEGYAQAYQLLLNAAGIDNIFVVGDAGTPGYGFGAHAWNLVQLDDGNWYWCDLTWDDQPQTQTGIIYNYFCVNDTQNVNLYNGISMSVKYSFTDSHKVCIKFGRDYEWIIELPDRSETVFVK